MTSTLAEVFPTVSSALRYLVTPHEHGSTNSSFGRLACWRRWLAGSVGYSHPLNPIAAEIANAVDGIQAGRCLDVKDDNGYPLLDWIFTRSDGGEEITIGTDSMLLNETSEAIASIMIPELLHIMEHERSDQDGEDTAEAEAGDREGRPSRQSIGSAKDPWQARPYWPGD